MSQTLSHHVVEAEPILAAHMSPSQSSGSFSGLASAANPTSCFPHFFGGVCGGGVVCVGAGGGVLGGTYVASLSSRGGIFGLPRDCILNSLSALAADAPEAQASWIELEALVQHAAVRILFSQFPA